MHQLLSEKKPAFQAALDHLQKELLTLRTGRANPAMIEDIMVPAYDSAMELKAVASIAVQDAKTMIVTPWDKTVLQAIEKAIRDAKIGISPAVDGDIIRISLPPMTEDNRKSIVKLVKEKVEEAKISLRSVREGTRDMVNKLERENEIGEDEKYKLYDELDKLTRSFQDKVEELGARKEAEVLNI